MSIGEIVKRLNNLVEEADKVDGCENISCEISDIATDLEHEESSINIMLSIIENHRNEIERAEDKIKELL